MHNADKPPLGRDREVVASTNATQRVLSYHPHMRVRQQALQNEVKTCAKLGSQMGIRFYVSETAGGRSVPESLLPTKTLSVHSDMEMGRHLQ